MTILLTAECARHIRPDEAPVAVLTAVPSRSTAGGSLRAGGLLE